MIELKFEQKKYRDLLDVLEFLLSDKDLAKEIYDDGYYLINSDSVGRKKYKNTIVGYTSNPDRLIIREEKPNSFVNISYEVDKVEIFWQNNNKDIRNLKDLKNYFKNKDIDIVSYTFVKDGVV